MHRDVPDWRLAITNRRVGVDQPAPYSIKRLKIESGQKNFRARLQVPLNEEVAAKII
jgi:hypothetical protein